MKASTGVFHKKLWNLRRDLEFFFARALKILFDVDRIGEEGDEADPLDVESPWVSDGQKSEKIDSSSVPRSTSDSDPTQESVPESAELESESFPSTRNASELRTAVAGTCVVPGIQLNLPGKFDVIYTNVL